MKTGLGFGLGLQSLGLGQTTGLGLGLIKMCLQMISFTVLILA